MTQRTRAAAALTVVALTGGLIATSPAVVASATPRVSLDTCKQLASTTTTDHYTINDSSTEGTTCKTNTNGTYIFTFTRGAKRGCPTVVVKRRCPIVVVGQVKRTRGDTRVFAKVTYVHGKTVIVKRVPVRGNGTVKSAYKPRKRGNWTVVIRFKKVRLSTVVKAT